MNISIEHQLDENFSPSHYTSFRSSAETKERNNRIVMSVGKIFYYQIMYFYSFSLFFSLFTIIYHYVILITNRIPSSDAYDASIVNELKKKKENHTYHDRVGDEKKKMIHSYEPVQEDTSHNPYDLHKQQPTMELNQIYLYSRRQQSLFFFDQKMARERISYIDISTMTD